MARYAMVADGCNHVVNVIEWDPETVPLEPPPGITMVEDVNGAAGPGMRYVDGVFEPVPQMQIVEPE